MHVTWIQVLFINIYVDLIGGYQLPVPDFESQWLLLQSNAGNKSKVEVAHGLNEVPLLVDVQIKSLEAPNNGFIFQATGGIPRDDDEYHPFGGVTYLYDREEVIVFSPVKYNHYPSGHAIYAENGNFYMGANNQTSDIVRIRVRAWLRQSLPPADFVRTHIHMKAGDDTNVSDVFVDLNHGFNEYPAMAVVRVNLTDRLGKVTAMSDAVDTCICHHCSNLSSTAPVIPCDTDLDIHRIRANFVTYNCCRRNSYTVYGMSKQQIRVWIDSNGEAAIFEGFDGHQIDIVAYEGTLEMYAWKDATMDPQKSSKTSLGPSVLGERFEMLYKNTMHDPFTRAWVRSNSGPNAGFMFLGSGAMAYARSSYDNVCSYGGLMYAYNTEYMRFWRPKGSSSRNGGLVCVSNVFGKGMDSQMSLDADVVIRSWGVATKYKNWRMDFQIPTNNCVRKTRKAPYET